MEFTFFQLRIKFNFLKFLQHKMYIVFMIYHVLWKNENFINVTNHKIIQVFTKHIIHQMLTNNRYIGKAKRHHNIFKITITCFECRLPFVTFSLTHLGESLTTFLSLEIIVYNYAFSKNHQSILHALPPLVAKNDLCFVGLSFVLKTHLF
jgi:hypothetical protein